MSRQIFCEQAIEVLDDIVLYTLEGKKVDAGMAADRLANLAEVEFGSRHIPGLVEVRGELESTVTPSKMSKDIQLKVSVSNSLENRELLACMGVGVNVVGHQLDLECAVEQVEEENPDQGILPLTPEEEVAPVEEESCPVPEEAVA